MNGEFILPVGPFVCWLGCLTPLFQLQWFLTSNENYMVKYGQVNCRLYEANIKIFQYRGWGKITKVKVKCTLVLRHWGSVQALRLCTGCTAHRGSRRIALLFLDHSTRRGEGSASRPGRSLPPGKKRYPLYKKLLNPRIFRDPERLPPEFRFKW